MGTNLDEEQGAILGEGNSIIHRFLLACVIVGVIGAGVTGTLLWQDNQPQNFSSSQTSPVAPSTQITISSAGAPISGDAVPVAPNMSSAASADSQHEPPANLTAGMSPAQAAVALGNWYFDHEAWPNAVSQYQKALDMGLNTPDVRTDYGSALRFSGQPQKALEQYRLAHKQDPKHENSLFNQGGVYASELNDSAKAIAAWQQYIKEFPQGHNVAQARLLIEREQGKLKPT